MDDYCLKQFRELSVSVAFIVMNKLCSVPHFHYLPEISDIWILFHKNECVAWMWETKWDDTKHAIRMIDTFQKGHNYAQKLICMWEVNASTEQKEKSLFPLNVVPSARNYWLRYFEEDTWLNSPDSVKNKPNSFLTTY
jgi:hypothetical protein